MTEFEAFYAEQAGDAHACTGRRVPDMYGIFDVKPERRNGRGFTRYEAGRRRPQQTQPGARESRPLFTARS